MPKRAPSVFMWAQAVDLLDRVEKMQRQMFRPGTSSGRPAWEPPVDLFETADEYRILVALPGVSADQLDVLLEDRTLIVTGERSFPLEDAGSTLIHRLELPYGRFERRIELPPGPLTIGARELTDGCLMLVLHKG